MIKNEYQYLLLKKIEFKYYFEIFSKYLKYIAKNPGPGFNRMDTGIHPVSEIASAVHMQTFASLKVNN